MDTYSVLFIDSFKSLFIFSLSQESLWFAAREFGTLSIWPVTLVCMAGSMCGAAVTIAVAKLISRLRKHVIELDEELFERLSTNFTKYGIYIFFFQMMPFCKVFLLFAGLFVVNWRKLILIVFAGRIVYYAYYLYFFRDYLLTGECHA